MQKCRVCGASDFYKEAGYFFCQTCQTQNENVREEVLELRVDNTTRLRKTRIRQLRSDKSGEELGWTSWELYNFVLIGLTNELIELGVTTEIKLTILQLWATYLGKVEVAFISTRKKCMPKLARRYKKRDAEIIYGKVQSQKKSRKRKRAGSSTNTSLLSTGHSEGTSMRELNKNKRLLATADYDRYLQSQGSSEGDGVSMFSQSVYSIQSGSAKSIGSEVKVRFSSHAKEEARKIKRLSKSVPRSERIKYRAKHISTQYKMSPHIITPMRLWAIIYIALRIHDQPIQLADMLRYAREGHLSYYKLDHLLPPEVSLTAKERNFLTQNVEITHKGMRRIVASMARFLGVWDIVCPDFSSLVSRYCQELGLPKGIQLYTERLIALSPPKMIFDTKKSHIPNYEGRAIAFIIVVLKILLALDGVTEYEISRIAEKINGTSKFTIELGNRCMEKMDDENISRRDNTVPKVQRRIGQGECKCYESNGPCIIVHGGAGDFSDTVIIEKMTACKKAAINGYEKLISGGTSVDAVESALWWLECDEFFNSGYGSVLNELEKVQMDASIMDGRSFKCGSVAAVSEIEHPITLAKYVMNNFPNTIFVGDGVKKLAKHANINCLSEGNMVAPAARVAFYIDGTGSLEASIDDRTMSDIDMLKNSYGTVGCVAYDGYSIAAGTSTGGVNKKLLGRVGDTPILGCGTYASRNVGCSLTGHGESIMKFGLAREIVESVERGLSSGEALSGYFDRMLKKYEKVGGGVVLESNGRWATYFTSNKMSYAVIEDDLITYGARLYEERREMYKGEKNNCDIAIDRGLLSEKLFSFQEWQRYIECRKTILVHAHFPTKMKYSPDSDGIDDLYMKFFEFVSSKTNREEAEMKNSKHHLPAELVTAMARHVTGLNIADVSSEAVDIFPPSLTPLHSYFQYLLDHPLYDIPAIARRDFYHSKVGYMTRPDSLLELALRCDFKLEIIDANVHFLEKYVPLFEQPRMPGIEELKQLVDVEDGTKHVPEVNENESLNDYLHAKIPCVVKVDCVKKRRYDRLRETFEMNSEIDEPGEEFAFAETRSNGKLAIPSDSDSEDETKKSVRDSKQGTPLLGDKSDERYNLRLSRPELESILNADAARSGVTFRKAKAPPPRRNAKGRFVKGDGVPVKMTETRHDSASTTGSVNIRTNDTVTEIEIENGTEKELFVCEDISISEFGLDDTDIKNGFLDLDEFNFSDISFLNDCTDTLVPDENEKRDADDGEHRFFNPFKEYWMYHCIFSRVKPKNFSVFERSLPRTFRWLLNECALIVEMSTEDLYEEVCLIETYHSQILAPGSSRKDENDDANSLSKNQLNFILNKW